MNYAIAQLEIAELLPIIKLPETIPSAAAKLFFNLFYMKKLSLLAALCMAMTVNAQSTGDLIDMGLSVKWHSCNYGASKPSDIGTVYAFATTKAGGYSNQYSYPFFDSNTFNFNLPTDNIAGTDMDAAWAASDGACRMATNDEWQELIDNCTVESTTIDGKTGIMYTSKINGNSIFLPNSGDRWGQMSQVYYASQAKSANQATIVQYYNSKVSLGTSSTPYEGRPIRPVVEEAGAPLTGITISADQTTIFAGTTLQLKALPVPDDAKIRNAVWSSSNPEIATVSNKGLVKGIGDGDVTISVLCGDVTGNISLKVVKVETPADEEYVDLGLSVRWAAKNLGASDAKPAGDKYPWGYLTPDVIDSHLNYSFFNQITFQYALPATDICGNKAYDAIAASTDGRAQLPNTLQIEELIANCDCTETTINGQNGLLLTSRKNGKSIFLPTPENTVMFYSGITNSGKTSVDVLRYDSGEKLYATSMSQPYRQWYLRGVQYNTGAKLEALTMSQEELSLYELNTAELSVTPTPLDYKIGKVNWSTSDDAVAIVTAQGLVIAQSQAGQCNIYAEVDGVRAVCKVTVSEIEVAQGECVDMGSNMLWRTCNLGADNPWEQGLLYGFGSTEAGQTITDYPDDISGTEYDAAHTVLGAEWHIPSPADFETLIENTDMEWVNWHGTTGALLTSKINGNKLFFPKNILGQVYYNSGQVMSGSPTSAQAYHADEYGQQLSGISTNALLPLRAVSSTIGTSVDGIEQENALKDVYTLSGIPVKKDADKTFIDTLPAGLYIIAGKKIAK